MVYITLMAVLAVRQTVHAHSSERSISCSEQNHFIDGFGKRTRSGTRTHTTLRSKGFRPSRVCQFRHPGMTRRMLVAFLHSQGWGEDSFTCQCWSPTALPKWSAPELFCRRQACTRRRAGRRPFRRYSRASGQSLLWFLLQFIEHALTWPVMFLAILQPLKYGR